jgi:hypothetical protein
MQTVDITIQTSEIDSDLSISEWSEKTIEVIKNFLIKNKTLPPILLFLKFENDKLFHCTATFNFMSQSLDPVMHLLSEIIPSFLLEVNAFICVFAMVAESMIDESELLIILTDSKNGSDNYYWEISKDNYEINLKSIKNDSLKIPTDKFPGFGIFQNETELN